MQQLTYVGPRLLEWREVTAPRLTADHEVLVRPMAVSRCDLDLYIATGAAGWPGPFALGHETVGVVAEVGDQVRGFRPGDRVIVPFQLSCGACDRCRAGLTGLCKAMPYRASYGMAPLSGVDFGGGLSDLMRVPYADHMLLHAPDGVSLTALAGVADNVTNALVLVARPLAERPRAAVLVVGGQGGGIGPHVVQCALALGADKVVYVEHDPLTLQLVARLGAEVVDLAIGPATPAIGMFALTIDASGSPDGLAFAIRCTDYEGLCQRTYGGFAECTPTPLREMYARGITLQLGRIHARARMPETLDLVTRQCLHPEQAVTRVAGFADAAEAMLDPTNKVVFVA